MRPCNPLVIDNQVLATIPPLATRFVGFRPVMTRPRTPRRRVKEIWGKFLHPG